MPKNPRSANGPYATGGFTGKGPKRNRMTSQKPSNAGSGGGSARVVILIAGALSVIPTALVAGLAYVYATH